MRNQLPMSDCIVHVETRSTRPTILGIFGCWWRPNAHCTSSSLSTKPLQFAVVVVLPAFDCCVTATDAYIGNVVDCCYDISTVVRTVLVLRCASDTILPPFAASIALWTPGNTRARVLSLVLFP